MRDRKTSDSYQYRRSPHGKGPKLKARTSEKAGKRRRRRELLKDLGPRRTESPRVERPERPRTSVRSTESDHKRTERPKRGRRRKPESADVVENSSKDLGPRTSRDRETESPRVERPERLRTSVRSTESDHKRTERPKRGRRRKPESADVVENS